MCSKNCHKKEVKKESQGLYTPKVMVFGVGKNTNYLPCKLVRERRIPATLASLNAHEL